MNDLGPVQIAVVAALRAAPATYPVYDAVPQGAAFPYIVVGEFTALPDEELAFVSTDASLTLHGWSSQASKGQSHAILQFIRDRLDGQMLGGAWAFTEDFTSIMEDPKSTAASRLYHSVARFRVRL